MLFLNLAHALNLFFSASEQEQEQEQDFCEIGRLEGGRQKA